MKKISLTLLVFFIGTISSAQTQALVDTNLRFISNERLSGLYIQTGPAVEGQPLPTQELISGTHSRSESSRYKGPQTLTILRAKAGPDNEKLFTPVASTLVPLGCKDVLIALVTYRDKEGNERYVAQSHDDGVNAFPIGSMRILNMTPITLHGRIGTVPIEVPTGISVIPAIQSGANKHLALGFVLNGQALPVSDQSYFVEPNERVLVSLLPPFRRGAGTIRARIIRDTGYLDLATNHLKVAQTK